MLIRRHGRQIGLERFAHHDPGPAKRILANDARKDKTLSALFDSADKPADAMRTVEAATGGTRNSRPGLAVHDEPVEIAGLPGFLGIGGHPGQPAMQRGNNMRLRIFTIVLTGIVLMTLAASLVVAGDACSLLTQSQVSEALGMSVGAGTPISGPASCQWMGKGKWATRRTTCTSAILRTPDWAWSSGKATLHSRSASMDSTSTRQNRSRRPWRPTLQKRCRSQHLALPCRVEFGCPAAITPGHRQKHAAGGR